VRELSHGSLAVEMVGRRTRSHSVVNSDNLQKMESWCVMFLERGIGRSRLSGIKTLWRPGIRSEASVLCELIV